MIVGSGSISKLLNDREGFRFFAAGISYSSYDGEVGPVMMEAARIGIETGLAKVNNEMFVYFSSISIFLKQTPYTDHKLSMENAIKTNCDNYTIIRLGNVWECTNPNTFRNYLKTHPCAEIRENEYKYMISKKQLNFITDNLPITGKHEISIFGELLTVSECLKR